jgi:hypothetical protein
MLYYFQQVLFFFLAIKLTALSFDTLNSLQVFLPFGSVDSSFPTVTLYFMGGVAMTVKPENYLLQQASVVSQPAVYLIKCF